eukprot:5742328-Ditylum_brightwellii.AAC.1
MSCPRRCSPSCSCTPSGKEQTQPLRGIKNLDAAINFAKDHWAMELAGIVMSLKDNPVDS